MLVAASAVTDVKTLLGAFGVGVTVAGAVGAGPLPVAGFERAAVVALRSIRRAPTKSLRREAVATLSARLHTMDHTAFVAVLGQKVRLTACWRRHACPPARPSRR